VNHNLNRNDACHHGFIYQNPNYTNATFYRHSSNYGIGDNLKLATIYVKPQEYKGINSHTEALKQGTAFSELYRPFVEKSGGLKR